MALEPIQYGAYFNRASAYDVIIPDGSSSGSGSGSSDVPTPVAHTYVGDHLCGWTDLGQTLYAWTCEENVSGGYYNNDATYTIYTTTENPTTSSTFYDKDGNEFNPLNGTVVYDNEGLGNSYTINSAQIETTDGTTNINFYTYIASGSDSGDISVIK